jgi:hypothetical protein
MNSGAKYPIETPVPGNDYDPALGDVFLEFLDKSLSIRSELLTIAKLC